MENIVKPEILYHLDTDGGLQVFEIGIRHAEQEILILQRHRILEQLQPHIYASAIRLIRQHQTVSHIGVEYDKTRHHCSQQHGSYQ